MLTESSIPVEIATAEVEIKLGDRRLRTKVSVPAGPTRMVDLLPIVHRISDAIVDSAVEDVKEQGRTVSCAKGCGKCCRQLVPISEVEARHIADLVENLPEPRRTHVRERFADAQSQLDATGMLATLRRRADWNEDEFIRIGTDYFQRNIACPFLEEESCSIHLDRPATCREYLVTSPAANCACPTKDNLEKVDLPVQVWTALARCTQADPDAKYCRWVPLVIAPQWHQENPDTAPPRPGPEMLREFFERLAGQVPVRTVPGEEPPREAT